MKDLNKMESIQQVFSVPFSYDVLFTENVFEIDNDLLLKVIGDHSEIYPAKLLCVIDEGVALAHPDLANQIVKYAAAYEEFIDLRTEPIIIAGGEQSKNDFSIVEEILTAIHDFNICRHSYVIGIGGGAVLDTVGFASSIAHRGVRHIRIPTTVLSQNDSGVGVKNGINFFGKKNFLGSFGPPTAVINDISFLTTLDDRDWRSGIAEAIKVALIKDSSFFEWLEAHAVSLSQRDLASMQNLIFWCAKLHMEHISGGDPFEKGSSRPLDFGHWAAHKLEQMTNYSLRHGEAVAIGIAIDVVYAKQAGMLSQDDCDRIIHLIHSLGFNTYVSELINQKNGTWTILEGLEEFREHLGGQLTIMLLEEIGKGINVNEMDPNLIQSSIKELETNEQETVLN